MLWDEKKETSQTGTSRLTSAERLSQVWFAGVHANVGGGYPDDSLPLKFHCTGLGSCGGGEGLRQALKTANPDALAKTKEAQDKDDVSIIQERSGYLDRYGPGGCPDFATSCFRGPWRMKSRIDAPKIPKALRRINNHAHVYAPIGIPHDYELVVTVPKANGIDADLKSTFPVTPGPNVYKLKNYAQARVVRSALRSGPWFTFRDRRLGRVPLQRAEAMSFSEKENVFKCGYQISFGS